MSVFLYAHAKLTRVHAHVTLITANQLATFVDWSSSVLREPPLASIREGIQLKVHLIHIDHNLLRNKT